MYLFTVLYCDGEEKVKLGLIYDFILGMDHRKTLKPTDEHLIRRIESLIMIPTLLLANIIEQQNTLNA